VRQKTWNSLQLIEVNIFFFGNQYIYQDEWHKNVFSISKFLKTCNFVIERLNKFFYFLVDIHNYHTMNMDKSSIFH
jgi:hypothetical protein